jgi:hypothetical protein
MSGESSKQGSRQDPSKHLYSRRSFLKVVGTAAAAAGVGYLFLDSQGYLGPGASLRKYIDYVELMQEASTFGDNGDRVAFAVDYLQLPPNTISAVMESWNDLSSATQDLLGNAVPTATAAIVADELTNPMTSASAKQYPNLLWVHAHSNAIFTFPLMMFVENSDPRLIKMADLKLSEGNVEVLGQLLGLYYPETNPAAPSDYGKRRYVREGFAFFAENYGLQLESMDMHDVAIVTEQSIAAAVTVPDSASYSGVQTNSGDTFIFFDTPDIPLYAFSAVDNTVAVGDLIQYGSLAVGLNTMKQFRARHPGLQDSASLPLTGQGYVQIDDLFMQDPLFTNYLYKGFYQGAFSIDPDETTYSWKEYQSVGLVPEQTIRGLDVDTIGSPPFHPAYCQPLSIYEVDPSIDGLDVQSPEVYVPSSWHLGTLFNKI